MLGICRVAYALSLTLNSERNYYENMIKNEVDFGSRLLRATAFCTFILNGIHNAHNHKLVSRKAVCALVLKGIRNNAIGGWNRAPLFVPFL